MLCKCSGKYIDIYFILKITFYITLRFLNQLVGATLAQLLGYACPGVSYASAVSLSLIRHAFAVGVSIPFWDSST